MKEKKPKIVSVLLSKIDEPQVCARMEINPERVQELADSIKAIGLMQPIVLRPVTGNRYEIIAGHRRFLAHRLLKRESISAIIRVTSDAETIVARASENLQRTDLTWIEEARIYSQLRNEAGMSIDKIASMIGKSAGQVKRRLDLLHMSANLQKAIHEGKISGGVAEELYAIKDNNRLDYYLGFAVDHGCTVLVAREWAREEAKQLRQQSGDVAPGGWGSALPETMPVYVACDLCREPMQIGKETVVRACIECVRALKALMEKTDKQ